MCSDHSGGSNWLRVSGNTLATKTRNFGRSCRSMSRPWPLPWISSSEPITAGGWDLSMSGSDAGEAAHRVAAERRLTTVDPRLREQEAGEHEEQHDRDPQLADRAVEQVRAPGPGPVRVRVHPHVQHDDG